MRVLWFAYVLLSAAASAAAPIVVGLGDQATPPFKRGDDRLPDDLPGLAIELLQQAAMHCKTSLTFKVLPGARMLKELESGELNAAALLSYSSERAAYAAYPMQDGKPAESQRLATLSYVFYARVDHRFRWDGSQLLGLNRYVGTNLGWSVNHDLARLGIPAEPITSVEQNFMKLQLGRIDAYATHEQLGDHYLASHDGLNLTKLLPPIVSKPYYLIFSRSFATRHPPLTSCLWRQIGMRRDRLYQQRMSEYLD